MEPTQIDISDNSLPSAIPQVNDIAEFAPVTPFKQLTETGLARPEERSMESILDKIAARQTIQTPVVELSSNEQININRAIDAVAKQNDQEQSLNSAISIASKINPDSAAQAQQLGQKTGLGQDLVMRNMDEVKRKAQIQEIIDLNLPKHAPKLAQMFASDPEFASVAHTDASELMKLTENWKDVEVTGYPFVDYFIPAYTKQRLIGGFARGEIQAETKQLFRDIAKATTEEEAVKIEAQKFKIDKESEDIQPITSGWIAGPAYGVSQFINSAGNVWSAGWKGAVAAGGAAALFTGANPIATGVAALGGGAVASVFGFANDSFESNAGEFYFDLRKKGYDRPTAMLAANLGGTVMASIDVVSFGFASAFAGKALSKLIQNEVIARIATKPITEAVAAVAGAVVPKTAAALIKPSITRAVGQAAFESVKGTASEITGEMSQDAVQYLSETITYHLQSEENQKKLQSPDGLQEFASQLVETAVQTMQMTLPLQLPGSMIHIYNTNKSIQQQKLRSKWMGNLKEKVDSIPLTKRSPITMQQFIAKSAEGTNASTVYIDGEELAGVLNQLQIPDDQIDSVLPGVRAQMKVAIETGGDVKISIGEYMTNVGKTPVLYNALEQHVKIGSESGLASGAVSAKQAIALQESSQQNMKDAQAEMAVQEKVNAQFVREAKEIEKVVNDQLVAAGRPPTEAAFAAKLVQARAVTAAAAAGITPAQWVANHPVPKMQSQQQAVQQAPAQGTLEQAQIVNATVDGVELVSRVGEQPRTEPRFAKSYEWGIAKEVAKLLGETGKLQIYDQAETGSIYGNIIFPDGKIKPVRIADHPSSGQGVGKTSAKRLVADAKKNAVIPFSATDPNTLRQDAVEKSTTPKGFAKIAAAAGIKANTKAAMGSKTKTGREFKLGIQKRVLDAAATAGIDLSVYTPEVRQYLISMAVSDAIAALDAGGSSAKAVGWYNEKVTKALRKIGLIHPEILTDPQAKFVFIWALATTSNGIKVDKNFRLAEEAYRYYKKSGKLPTNIGMGTSSAAINAGLQLFNKLSEKYSFEELEAFFTTKHTVKEVDAFTGRGVSGENQTTIVYGSAALGAKVGNGFFSNLYGHFEQLTIDRWLMRTWGRWSGNLVEYSPKNVAIKQKQLKSLIALLSKSDSAKLSDIIGVNINTSSANTIATAIKKASSKEAVRIKIIQIASGEKLNKIVGILGEPKANAKRIGVGDEIRKTGNSLWGYLDGQKEQPEGAVERGRMRDVFAAALAVIQQRFPDLTMADLQAVLWYPEKNLYDTAKADEGVESTYEEDKAPDFDNAAQKLALELGVTKEQLDEVTAQVDRDIIAERGSRRPGRSLDSGGYDGGVGSSQVLSQSAVPATFYSALGVEVGKSTTKSASADSWKQQIKGLIAKGVVKEKEVYWSGLDNWLDLQEGKITKEQVQAFLNAGGVKVKVVQLEPDIKKLDRSVESGTAYAKLQLEERGMLTPELESAFAELEQLNATNGDRDRRLELHSIIDKVLVDVDYMDLDAYIETENSLIDPSIESVKYEGYQLPGGTNYREALVTLPSDALGTRKIMEGDKVVAIAKNDPYRSAHWDQENVLVHLRMNDRVDADGKKVLFVEEVQSDWGQAGREEGFTTREMTSRRNAYKESMKRLELLRERTPEREKIDKDANKALEKIKNPWFNNYYSAFMDIAKAEDWRTKFDLSSLTKKQIEHLAKRREIQVAELKEEKFQQTETADNIWEGVTAAPFVETTSGWLELGLKQILLEAVNGKYDRVAFVDGDQSVERYRKALTGAVDEVQIARNNDGTYTYSAIRDGNSVQGEQSVSANRINEVFGKTGSKQLLEQADAKPEQFHTIASNDIQIGGEGMRKFYDTIVPQALNKMLKKLGGDKIGEVNIGKSVGRKINAKEFADEAVKLMYGDIDTDEFSDNLDLEEGDIPNSWIDTLLDVQGARFDKAGTRKIAIEFAAKVKDKFASGKKMSQQGFIVTPALAEQVSQGLPLFQAAEGGARGEIDPVKNLITIKNANSLTVFHELMHWFVIDLFRTATDPAASALSKSDADILLKWFGIGGSNMQERIANWNAMTLEEQRRHHETAAYNAEIWVATGRAPSVELQGVFERFRRWATRAYKSIRDNLNEIYRDQFGIDLPFLTDEVRGVFDRMLASEEQIARREAIDNFKGMYQTQEESGMNDGEWAAMQAQIAESHETSVTELLKETVKEMKWESNAKEGFFKKLQDAEDGFRKVIRSEESDKMGNEPARKAERFFKTGKMVDPSGKEIEVLVGNKIDSVAVGGMYPTSTTGLAPAVDLTKLRGMTMEGGLAPDLAAEMFGFSSGDELIRALAELKPFKDELQERTDARMLDEHGGMNTEAEKEEAVNKALANEVRARIVAIENRYLTKVKTPVAVIMQGAKELARTILGRMAIKDIKPRNYVASEAKVAKDKHTAVKAMQSPETAGKSAYTRSFNEQIAAGVEESVAASEALVKSVEAIKRAQAKIDAHKKQYGDVDPAIVAKKASHQQVIQNQLAKEGYKILEEVDKALAYVKRIVSDVNRKNMGADHADQIEAILERFGLMGRYVAPTTRTPLATWAQVQQDIGFDIEIPDIVQESVRKNFLELTPEEFQDVIDTVKQIAHTGKTQQLVLTMDRKITFEKAKTEIVDSINANAGGRKAKTRTASTNAGRRVEASSAFFAAHYKAAIVSQIMDGGKDGGPLWNYLIRSANTAGDKETTMNAAATKRISEILDPVFKNGKMGGSGVYFPSIDRSLNREQVLVIALNMGNEGNMQRLLDGEGWTLEQVMPIIQSLTAAELNAVQEIWDHSETYKTEIIEMYRRTAGREPKMLEPKPLQVMSSDGQMVSLKGGYYPAKYDPKASARTQSLTAAEQALRDLRDARMASTTRNSYAKPRSKEVHDRPLLLNLSALYSGIGEVIHDLSWREWLIDANRLMRSSSFDKAVREQYGTDFLNQIKTWIEDVAAGNKGVTNAGEMVANFARQGISAAGLTFNIMSAAGQITGFAQSVIKVGLKWIGRGIAASVTNPKAAIERVYALSPFMANRGRTQFRELNEIKNMVQGESVAMKRVKAGGYFLMLQMQRVVDIPTWIGAYEKQLSINSDEKLAIALADQAVIDSQGGGMLKDLSAIERGGPMQKLFTVFYSFMNTNLNLAVLKGMTEKNAGKWVAQQAMLWVAPVVTMYMLKKLLTPQSGDDDKWDLNEIAKELAAEELSFLMGSFMGIRELAPIAPIITGAKTYGTDYRGPAGLRMLGDTITFATQARQLEFDTAFRKAAINIIGDGAGLPSAQINRTIDGIEALLEGETENITAPLFGVKKR
jgi:hypothetical protein